MTDPEFMSLAESLLRALELSCDRINDESDADVDNQRVGSMVTLTFANRSQIIVNLQKPLHEVWMAAKSGGYHYKWSGTEWQDTKGQGEFFAALSANASQQTGMALVFTAAEFLKISIIFFFSSAAAGASAGVSGLSLNPRVLTPAPCVNSS